MKHFILVLLILSSACAKKTTPAAAAEKGLFSSWTRTDNQFVLDLTGGQIGVSESFTFTTATSQNCTCTAVLNGTTASGTFALSSCTYTGGGSGDPGCTSLNSTGTFTLQASQLQFCDSGGCASYR